MALLALYWSIMIACYLLASRLRKYAEKFKFVDKLMSLSVYALVLLMGLRMGADEEVTSSLGSIGIQALFVTVLTAAGSMLGAFAVRKLLHIDRHAHPAGAVVNEAEAVHENADVSGAKMSFIILLMVVVGMLLGDLVIRRVCTDLPAFQSRSGDYLVVGLCIMLGLIGFSMGLDGSIARILRNAGLGVILVPIFAVLGTLLGGAVYAALSPMTLREGLAISAGFGWYTMAPSVIASAGHTMASAVSFLHNVLREMLGIILLPVIAGKIGYIEAITIPGTASTDVCLPIVEQVCNSETVAYSFCTGMLMCITSAMHGRNHKGEFSCDRGLPFSRLYTRSSKCGIGRSLHCRALPAFVVDGIVTGEQDLRNRYDLIPLGEQVVEDIRQRLGRMLARIVEQHDRPALHLARHTLRDLTRRDALPVKGIPTGSTWKRLSCLAS